MKKPHQFDAGKALQRARELDAAAKELFGEATPLRGEAAKALEAALAKSRSDKSLFSWMK